VVEHLLDMEVVGGSIPLATTNSLTRGAGLALRPLSPICRNLWKSFPEIGMHKFLGSKVGIVFLVKAIY
jgi:hypothetical protein